MFSLSATAFPVLNWHTSGPAIMPGTACGVFLHRMMGKSHGHDKRLSPQGSLQG
jgi:hypothetical protein